MTSATEMAGKRWKCGVNQSDKITGDVTTTATTSTTTTVTEAGCLWLLFSLTYLEIGNGETLKTQSI